MKQLLCLSLAAILLAAPALADAPESKSGEEMPAGEAELAQLLEGHVAGEPVRCLRRHQRDGLQVVDSTAFVFRDGRTLYVNRPSGARFLSEWDLPVFTQFSSSLCQLDQVELRDRHSLMHGPVLFLAEFVPYTKPPKES